MDENLSLEPDARPLKSKKRALPLLLPTGICLLKGLAGIDTLVFTQPVKPRLIETLIAAFFKQTPRAEIPS